MTGDAHEVYKELSTALNDLSKDVVKGLVALRAVAGDNKADIQRVEHRFEKAIERFQEKIEELQRKEAASEKELAALKKEIGEFKAAAAKKAETDGKVKIESTKGRWAFWVAVVGGSAGVITTILNMLANALGWGG